jgi:hypothetical protein
VAIDASLARAQALAILKWPDPFAAFSAPGGTLTIVTKPVFLGPYLLPHNPLRFPHPSLMSEIQRDAQIEEIIAKTWRTIRHVTERLTLTRQASAICALAVREGEELALKSTIRPLLTAYFSGQPEPVANGTIPALAAEIFKYRVAPQSPEWAPRFRAVEILSFFGKTVPTIYENGTPDNLITDSATWLT